MGIIGDKETLLQVAEAWGEFPITNLENASAFLQQLHAATHGWVIIDFLDAANWDSFESHTVNLATGILQINWHDFIKQDEQEPRAEDREMMAMSFPASLYGMAMRFNRIDRVGTDKIACFALRGYALTDKEVRKTFSPQTEEFLIRNDRPFSCEVIRKIHGHLEVIDCITSAAFTMLIIPKDLRIPAHTSKTFLYQHNLAEIDASLERCEKALEELGKNDVEAICEKANTARRSMETLLKLECCFRKIITPKPYSQACMGDLWSLLKVYHSEGIQALMSRFIQWANELSHDTGIPIDKSKAQAIALMARMYSRLFRQELEQDQRQSSWRPRDEEYIAF